MLTIGLESLDHRNMVGRRCTDDSLLLTFESVEEFLSGVWLSCLCDDGISTTSRTGGRKTWPTTGQQGPCRHTPADTHSQPWLRHFCHVQNDRWTRIASASSMARKTSCTFTMDVGNAWVVHIRIRAGLPFGKQPVFPKPIQAAQALERVVFRLAGKYTRAPSEPGKAAILSSHVCQASRCHRVVGRGGTIIGYLEA
jgi:hypothetical protein